MTGTLLGNHPVAVIGLAAATAAYAAVHRLGATYGSTKQERRTGLPGDDIVRRPQFRVTHAITIDVPSEQVWPWLVQMGWHRGGWYTARWVDRLLFPANTPSLNRLDPALQHLEVGDFVPDGPPESECGFTVVQLTPNRALVLHSTSHLPLSWRERLGAAIEWSWSFVLVPQNADRSTRFLFRWRGRVAPWWAVTGCWLLVIPADFVMSRDMLRGVKSRASGG
jgi:hypothetical protein